MSLYLVSLISFWSGVYGVNPVVALAVAKVESNFNSKAISHTGDYGIFQLNSKSFPDIKKSDLLNPEINVKLGVQYLAWNKKYCKYKENMLYLTCWNYGIGNAKKLKYPYKWPFYLKVKKTYDEMFELHRNNNFSKKEN
jgi:hypothetical protein